MTYQKKHSIQFLAVSLAMMALIACSKSSDTGSSPGTPSSSDCASLVTGQAGPLYTAVKSMMASNCSSCHTGNNGTGGKDLTTDCNIISSKDRIKARGVDGSPSFMPQGSQLSAADKKKITDWVNAGGRFSD